MLWWIVVGGALFVTAARRDSARSPAGLAADPSGRVRLAADYGLVRRRYPLAGTLLAVVLFGAAVVIAPVVTHAKARRNLQRRDGLLGKYYRSVDWKGDPVQVKIDGRLQFDWTRTLPLPAPFSVEWNGEILVPKQSVYTFAVQADDGALLEINGRTVVDLSKGPAFTKKSGTIELAPGSHKIRIRYFNSGGGGLLNVWWNATGRPERIISRDALVPSKLSTE